MLVTVVKNGIIYKLAYAVFDPTDAKGRGCHTRVPLITLALDLIFFPDTFRSAATL